MKIQGLNVCGLGNPRTFQVLKKLVANEDLNILFLLETKLLVSQLKRIRAQTCIARCMGVRRVSLGGA